MAAQKKQKYVSVRAATYEQLRAYCSEHNLSIGPFVQELCEAYLERRPSKYRVAPETPTEQNSAASEPGRLFTDEELAKCPQ